MIGSLLSTTLQPLLHSSGGTIALLCIWAAGLTLFTGWSWVSIAEKLGGGILSVLTFASNRTRRDDTGSMKANTKTTRKSTTTKRRRAAGIASRPYLTQRAGAA